MGAFLTAYVVVWLGIVLYVVRLGAEQRRLSRTVEGLRSHLEDAHAGPPPARRAA
jgi:CcmD family protein